MMGGDGRAIPGREGMDAATEADDDDDAAAADANDDRR
jgi:hypothetical protein